jgi:hypothetical protein
MLSARMSLSKFAWAGGRYDQLPSLAADLVSRRAVVIIAAGGAIAALATRTATSTIPIVVAIGDDPVKHGLVASLSHPGSNITGVTLFIDILTAKRLEPGNNLEPFASAAGSMFEVPQTHKPHQKTPLPLGGAFLFRSQPAGVARALLLLGDW